MSRWLQAALAAVYPSDKTDKTDKTPPVALSTTPKTTKIAVSSVTSVMSGGGRAVSPIPSAIELQAPVQKLLDPFDDDDLRMQFEERAAILEHDAALIPGEADLQAEAETGYCPLRWPDVEVYAQALKMHGPASYGAIGVVLDWGMTRAGEAETALREAGRIQYKSDGKGWLIDL